jgi:hypothetical protein
VSRCEWSALPIHTSRSAGHSSVFCHSHTSKCTRKAITCPSIDPSFRCRTHPLLRASTHQRQHCLGLRDLCSHTFSLLLLLLFPCSLPNKCPTLRNFSMLSVRSSSLHITSRATPDGGRSSSFSWERCCERHTWALSELLGSSNSSR